MKKLVLLFLTIAASTSLAQQLKMPEEVNVGEKIIAVCETANEKNVILWDYSQELSIEQLTDRLFIWGKPGKYTVEAIIIPLRTITVDNQEFDVLAGNISRVKGDLEIKGPDPGPDPIPPGPEPPFPAPGFAVIILREAKETLPASQQAIFTSSRVIKRLNELTVRIDNKPAFRFWDDDYQPEQFTNTPKVLKNAYYEVLKQANGRLPWIAISTGFSGPLPMTIEETLELINVKNNR